jgi:hydroxymethylpyrimidine pyrophosphatase-like HAD family hydrolase
MPANDHPHLIILDLDGTSVRYEPRLQMDPLVVDTLRDVRRHGVHWVMNSDRDFPDMRDIAMQLAVEDRPQALLSMQHLIFWLGEGGEYAADETWNRSRKALRAQLWEHCRHLFEDWHAEFGSRYTIVDHYVSDDAFALCVPPDEHTRLFSEMKERLSTWEIGAVSGNHEWVFIVHRDFSKASLVHECAGRMGVPVDRRLTVGDGMNDLSMLQPSAAGRVGCPANACSTVLEAVRRHGGHRSDHAGPAGTVDIIRRLFP